jgi:outer membrane protein assembly factor BamD (BamD/ComL family)
MLANIFDVVSWFFVVPLMIGAGIYSYFKTEDRRALAAKWIVSAVLLFILWLCTLLKTPIKALFILIPAVLLGLLWIPTVVAALIRPLTGAFDGGGAEVDPAPFYYLAEGKRRQGLFQEAIDEVEKQLERFPNDEAGFLLRATIEAEDLQNLPAAKNTLERLLAQKNIKPQSAAAALQTLADWHLQFGPDVAGARAALERLVLLFPNSQIAHAAEQRLAHLDGVVATREVREKATYQLPSQRAAPAAAAPPSEPDAHAAADELVKQLEKYPNDTAAREKLAVLYAERFQRLDLAAAQIEQLVSHPNETPKHVAQWFNLLATMHIKHGHDLKSAEQALQRIRERFPNSAMANIALARLSTLHGELKAGDSTTTKHLGDYEKDLGLKRSAV